MARMKLAVAVMAPLAIGLAAAPQRAAAADGAGGAAVHAADAASPDRVRDNLPGMTMAEFLDRLMLAESGGRDGARNPRSTAVGPFQFIEATWLETVRAHFAGEAAGRTPAELLARRTDRAFARRVAQAFTSDNAAHLSRRGHPPSFVNLRLAFLLGPEGAVRLLDAAPDTPLTSLMPAAVIQANPFMVPLRVRDLVQRAKRELDGPASGDVVAAADGAPATVLAAVARRPAIAVRCDLDRASCRRWLALAQTRRGTAKPARTAQR